MNIIMIVFLLCPLPLFAQESDSTDFSSVKELLKKDQLEEVVVKKQKKEKKKKEQNIEKERKLYEIPDTQEMLSFFSEMWLVKNQTVLKWDFKRPDYGLEDYFKKFLENMGQYEKSFKILVLNSPVTPHMALPAGKNEYIFLLSLPLMRTLDLSKQEISILLYEDMKRIELGRFSGAVIPRKLKNMTKKDFYKNKKIDKKIIKKILKNYDEFVFNQGYDFQSQYIVTKTIDQQFKSDRELWNSYYQLKRKFDKLLKSNVLYQNYSKLYPSPELQINWLTPKKD